jgi:hypothetical protein
VTEYCWPRLIIVGIRAQIPWSLADELLPWLAEWKGQTTIELKCLLDRRLIAHSHSVIGPSVP